MRGVCLGQCRIGTTNGGMYRSLTYMVYDLKLPLYRLFIGLQRLSSPLEAPIDPEFRVSGVWVLGRRRLLGIRTDGLVEIPQGFKSLCLAAS